MSKLFLGNDADGAAVYFGDRIRVRLSKLDHHGIPLNRRQGIMVASGRMWSAGMDAAFYVSVSDVRLDPPDGRTPSIVPPKVPPTLYDADGKKVKVGDWVRIRLSRLIKYHVTESDRFGYISGSVGPKALVKLGHGTVVVPAEDFRAD